MANTARPDPIQSRGVLPAGIVLALLSVLPFLVARYPQMSDYPAHLARYHVMLDGASSEWLARYYLFEWKWSGNLGVDLLIRPLAPLLGLETVGRLIGGLIPPLTGLAILTVEWALRRRIGIGALLAFVAIWSPALLMGFLNFTLSFALALFAFALWVRTEGRAWRAPLFVPAGLAIWLCHMSGWGVLGLMVFGYEWQRRGRIVPAALATWPLWGPLVPTLLFSGSVAGSFNYGRAVLASKERLFTQALRGGVEWLDVALVPALAVLLALAWRKGRLDGRVGRAAILAMLVALVMPRHFGGGDLADSRLAAVTVALACLAIDWPAPRWAMWLAPLPYLVRLIVVTHSWQVYSRQTEDLLGALDQLPRGARVASAVITRVPTWTYYPLEHVGSYAVVRRDALTNANFAVRGVHMLSLRGRQQGFADPSQRIFWEAGQKVDLASFAPARQADYLWYVGWVEPSSLPAGAQVIWRKGHSQLLRLANPPRDS